jgi:hypothetical protein
LRLTKFVKHYFIVYRIYFIDDDSDVGLLCALVSNDEKGGAHAVLAQGAFAQLVLGKKDYFQRRH